MPVRTGPRSSPWTTVRCSHCGSGFPLSIRNQQQCRSDGREPLCTSCRRPPVKLRDAERQRLEAWWRRRLPPEELAEGDMGDMTRRELIRSVGPTTSTSRWNRDTEPDPIPGTASSVSPSASA